MMTCEKREDGQIEYEREQLPDGGDRQRFHSYIPQGEGLPDMIDVIEEQTRDADGELIKVKTIFHNPFSVLHETPEEWASRKAAEEAEKDAQKALQEKRAKRRRKQEEAAELAAQEAEQAEKDLEEHRKRKEARRKAQDALAEEKAEEARVSEVERIRAKIGKLERLIIEKEAAIRITQEAGKNAIASMMESMERLSQRLAELQGGGLTDGD